MSENETVKKPGYGVDPAREELAAKTTDSKTQHADAGTSYASYLFGNAGAGDKPAWSDSTKGRFAIRMFTRGVMGTTFFVWGGRVARKQLQNYESYNYTFEASKPLAAVAQGLDRTIARGIESFAYWTANVKKAEPLAGETMAAARLRYRHETAWEATNFRTKAYYHDNPGKLYKQVLSDGQTIMRPQNGRSYGAEVVGVTFDFFMASIGDALGRNLVQGIDPNIKHSWMVDKEGNAATFKEGHFSPTNWLKTAGTTGWRVLTKNAGEDWVAGLFYVYQMKFQRQLLNNWFKGSKLVCDSHLNGAAFKVDASGKVIGDYLLPGAMDLHMRFVGYNWYTLMFREAYDKVADKFKHWRAGDAQPTEHQSAGNPILDSLHFAGHAARYVTKSFIKANLYMNPAVPFFWITRSPQAKWRGAFVREGMDHLENAICTTISSDERVAKAFAKGKTSTSTVEELQSRMFYTDPKTKAHDFNFSSMFGKAPTLPGIGLINSETSPKMMYSHNMQLPYPSTDINAGWGRSAYRDYLTATPLQRFEKRFSQALHLPGKLCYELGGAATKLANLLPEESWLSRHISWDPAVAGSSVNTPSALAREHVARNLVDAAMSYTPYMWAKQETGLRVDEHEPNKRGPMDYAIYRFIDSGVALKPREMITAGRDMFRLGINFDKNVISREGGIPKTQVVTNSIVAQRTAQPPAHPVAANNNEHSANDNEGHERSWAESVAGRQLGAQYQTAVPTRH